MTLLAVGQSLALCATAIQLGFLRRVVRTRAAGCTCGKGRVCAACLDANSGIRKGTA